VSRGNVGKLGRYFGIGFVQINRLQTRIGFSANQLSFGVKSVIGNWLSKSALNRQMAFALLCFREEVSICSLLLFLHLDLRLADLDGVEVRT
jgi:hypothetical protein